MVIDLIINIADKEVEANPNSTNKINITGPPLSKKSSKDTKGRDK